MKHHLHLLLAASFGAMSIGAAAAVHDWTVTRVGPFDNFLDVVDMNNAGQVAVSSVISAGRGTSSRAFLYTPGSAGGLVDLGSFGGLLTMPAALNATGQVVGWSNTPTPPIPYASPQTQAFLYQNGRMERLSLPGQIGEVAVDINDRGQALVRSGVSDSVNGAVIFNPGGPPTVLSVPGQLSSGGGINNRGQVFSRWQTPNVPGNRSFFYDNRRMVDIGTLGGHTNATDMNASGQIVGGSDAADGRPRPFLYSDGRMTEIGATNYGWAEDINDRGQVLGWHKPEQFAPKQDAFIYSDGQMREVGDLGGDSTRPQRLNEVGQVVGFSAVAAADPNFHAFFYSDDDGRTTDLTRWLMNSFDDVVVDETEMALNDLGQIAIGARIANGQTALFVLTPIPEPSTYALMLAGMGTLAWIAWRKRGRSMGNRGDQTPQAGLAA